jgi:pimeloyl-ACP methyl ester carboxylesterase
VALVLLHGWAGYRVGAHQMFVKLARAAVNRGFVCLRFDFRGRGDSEGDAFAATLATMIADTQAACAELAARLGVQRFALIGDCSGSEVAIGAGPLIDGCSAWVLWSAPIVGGSRESMDRAKRRNILRQYAAKLLRRETWAKLFRGKLQLHMIRRAILGGGKGAGEQGSASDKDIDWLGRFLSFRGPVLFIYGSADPTTADSVAHFERLTREAGRAWHLHLVEGANHAFYSVKWEREVIGRTLDWLEREL